MWDMLFEPKFIETFGLVFGVILFINLILTFLNRKEDQFKMGRANSFSWLLAVPFIFLAVSLEWPYSLAVLCMISIYGAKNFFQMTGMYHRSNFVWGCYLTIIFSTYCIYEDYVDIFNLMPIFMFFVVCLIPLIRNSYKHMVQYMALTLMNFCFIWAFLHLGWIMEMDEGVYTVIYIVLLTEFFDTSYLAISKYSKRVKLISNITPKRSLEGFIFAGAITVVLGWGMRHLLPVRTEFYWVAISLTCVLFASTGDSVLAVVRRDLGIKVTDSFILGRGDFFNRLDRLVFVAPIAHYVLFLLGEIQ